MRVHLVDSARLLVLIGVSSLFLAGCTVEAPLAPAPLGAIVGPDASFTSHQPLELVFEKTGGGQAGPTLTWTGTVTPDGQPFGALTTTTDAATWTPRGASSKAFDVRFEFHITRNASAMVLFLQGLLNLPVPSSNGPGLVNMNGIVREASGEFTGPCRCTRPRAGAARRLQQRCDELGGRHSRDDLVRAPVALRSEGENSPDGETS